MALLRPGGPTPPTQNGGATPPSGAQPPPHYGDPGGPAYRPPANFNPNVQIGQPGTVVNAPGTQSWALGQPPGTFIPASQYNNGGHALTMGTHPALQQILGSGTATTMGPPPNAGPPAWWPTGSPWPPGPTPNPPVQDGPNPGGNGAQNWFGPNPNYTGGDPYGPAVRPPVGNPILQWLLAHWQNGNVPPPVV